MGSFVSLICLHIFLVFFLFSHITASQKVVTSLPGFDGQLPFYLETGYIGVGDFNESQLFYYFVKSQRSPALDPLLLWISGGPGCSSFTAFLYENGPIIFNYSNYSPGLPSLQLNPSAWTQGLNILYLDAPVGTGFSYSTTQENYHVDDQNSTAQIYEFLRKWLIDRPQYLANQLFIGGDSYSGIPVPLIVKNILDGNEAGVQPTMNLKGYVLGNPKTDYFLDLNARVPFAHRLTLISDQIYQDAKVYCHGDYVNINPSNTNCVSAMNAFHEMILEINIMQVIEPTCQTATPRTKGAQGRRSLDEKDLKEDLNISGLNKRAYWCRNYYYVLSDIWANNKRVREALHVREGTTGVWTRCNFSVAYTKSVTSTIDYHKYFSKQNLRALVYSGDHDLNIPHIATQNWIHMLNLSINEYWRPWFVNGQVAGYTEKYMNGDYTLIFATVKGAGHDAPEYKPTECYAMIDRFFAYFPL